MRAETFCRLAWSHVIVSFREASTRICCKTAEHRVSLDELERLGGDAIDGLPAHRERRRRLASGERPRACNACWQNERQAIPSWRRSVGGMDEPRAFLAAVAERDPRATRSAEALAAVSHPENVEIRMGNACGLKCVYCAPEFSSAIEREQATHGTGQDVDGRPLARPAAADEAVQARFEEVFWRWFANRAGTIRVVTLIGGEPTTHPDLHDVLSRIAAHTRDWAPEARPAIGLITNLATPERPWKRLLDRVRAEPEQRFRFGISNEAFAERAEYIRHGLRWPRFESNLADLVALAAETGRVEVDALLTLNALCITSLGRYLAWLAGPSRSLLDATGRGIQPVPGLLDAPAYLSTAILPPRYSGALDPALGALADWPQDPKQRGWWDEARQATASLQLLEGLQRRIAGGDPPERLLLLFNEWRRRNDGIRGTDLFATFPEYAPLARHTAA